MQQEPPHRSECKGSHSCCAFLTAKPSYEAELNASLVLPVPHGRCPSSWCFRTSPSLRSPGNSSHQRMEPRTACLDELVRGLHGHITVTSQHRHSWSAREILRSWYFLLKCSLSSPSPLFSEAPVHMGDSGTPQKHRMVEVGRDLRKSSWPTPCSRRAPSSSCPGLCPDSF